MITLITLQLKFSEIFFKKKIMILHVEINMAALF